MRRRFRHPTLGEFHRIDVSKGSIGTTHVSDAELAGLVRYLNEAETRTEGDRIIRIVQEMLKLQKIEEPVWGETKEENDFSSGPNARPMMVTRGGMGVINPLLKRISPEKYRRQREIERRKFLLNHELARYHFFPYTLCCKGQWSVIWRIPSRVRLRHGELQFDEAAVLQMILDLARARYLDRLRRCSHCRQWLYAKYRHQSFCSTSCQQKYYRHSEERRTYRREYMRRYRNR